MSESNRSIDSEGSDGGQRQVVEQEIHRLADQLAQAVLGTFDFVVATETTSPAIQKLCLMLNFLLDTVSRTLLERNEAAQCMLEAERRLYQSEKMAAIGRLAGGVAHEINNPLGIILGFAQGLERRVSEGDPLCLPVSSIVRESLRCKALVHELLTFSRTGKKSAEPIDLNELIRSTVVLLESRAKTQTVFTVQDLGEDLPVIMANRTQIQQVIINLGTNAIDAMMGGGTLTLRTRRTGQDEAIFEVVDSGTGIPEDVRSRIFEPFFTTKEVGKGTGIGLSLVHDIVQQHAGVIDVESEVGKGTTMRIRLPALNPQVDLGVRT